MLSTGARNASLWSIGWTVAAVLVLGQFVSVDFRFSLAIGLIYGICCIGLDIYVGYGGQLNFATFGLAAVGAYVAGSLATDHGWSIWAALPAAVVASAVVGGILSIPAVVIPNLGSALVTFFFAYVVYELLIGRSLASLTHSADGLAVAPLHVGSTDLRSDPIFFYVCAAVVLVVLVISWRYANSRPGKLLRVIKRSSVVAEANGIAVNRTRRVAMVYASAVAGVAGFLYAQAVGYLSPESFAPLISVNILAMAVVGGLGSVVGPLLGALLYAFIDKVSGGAGLGSGAQVIFPVLLLVALIVFPDGLYGFLVKAVDAARRRSGVLSGFGRERAPVAGVRPARVSYATERSERGQSRTDTSAEELRLVLVINELSRRFGGVVALDKVQISVRQGTIHGIMGPNGAGKTTLLDCISGVQQYDGSVTFDGMSITRRGSRDIYRSGMARTFQSPALIPDLTVVDNVAIGALEPVSWWSLGGWVPTRQVIDGDRRSAASAHAVLDLLQFPVNRRSRPASELTLAEQKTVDVARALAGSPRLVLLDEPTAGLDEDEMDVMADALRAVRGAGVSVLVVAHHVGFLRGIADDLTVLDFGRVLAAGKPEEVLARSDVAEVYLGAAHV